MAVVDEHKGSEGRTQKLRVLAALSEDQNWFPVPTHSFTVACSARSSESNVMPSSCLIQTHEGIQWT